MAFDNYKQTVAWRVREGYTFPRSMRTLTMAKGLWKGVPAADLSAFWRSDSTPCQAVLRLFFIFEIWLKLCRLWAMGGKKVLTLSCYNVKNNVLALVVTSIEPVWSGITRGPSDGEFFLAWAARNEALIGGTLVLVRRASCISKLRLRLLHENTQRNICLNHFLGDCSFWGIDMARGRLR